MSKMEIIGDNYIGNYSSERIACRAFIIEDNKVLLTYLKNSDVWMIPGGGLEEGENFVECVKREVLEETGYIIDVTDPDFEIDEYYDRKWVNKYYIGKIIGEGNKKLTDAEERLGLEIRWVSIDEAVAIFKAGESFGKDLEIKAGLYYRELSALKRVVLKEEKMKLIEPTMEYDEEIQTYRRDFLLNGGSMDGCGSLRKFDDSKDWIDQVKLYKNKETTPLIPIDQYIYVRESDNKIVGVIQIRYDLNDYFNNFAGHIGYSVCPSERKKGYATQMLKLVLPKCKELGLDKILITCLPDNVGSKKVIMNNGGVYESTVYDESHDRYLERYWITL